MRFSRGQPAASVTSSAARVWFTSATAAALAVLLLGLLLPTESTHQRWPRSHSCRSSAAPAAGETTDFSSPGLPKSANDSQTRG